MSIITSQLVTPLEKAQAVYDSLGTQNPLYLGRHFTISKNPADEVPSFSDLLAGFNPTHPVYTQIKNKLQAIENQRNLSKAPPTHHTTTASGPLKGIAYALSLAPKAPPTNPITTAVSSVLPMTQNPYALPLAPPTHHTTTASGLPMMQNPYALSPAPSQAPLNYSYYNSYSFSVADDDSSTQMADTLPAFPFSYHERVNLWFTDPDMALAKKNCPNLREERKDKIKWVHNFSKRVDAFVNYEKYGVPCRWEDKRMVYIPAEVVEYIPVKDSTKYKVIKSKGGFQYTFLKNGTCYHRAWGEKTNPAIQAIWDQVDFPEESENKSPPPQEEPQEAIGIFAMEGINFDPQLGTMGLIDGNRVITIYKI